MGFFRRKPIERWVATIEIADGEVVEVVAGSEEELLRLIDDELGVDDAAEDPAELPL